MNKTQISPKAAEERREYKKEWRAKNRERVREYNRRYWEKRVKRKEGTNVKDC